MKNVILQILQTHRDNIVFKAGIILFKHGIKLEFAYNNIIDKKGIVYYSKNKNKWFYIEDEGCFLIVHLDKIGKFNIENLDYYKKYGIDGMDYSQLILYNYKVGSYYPSTKYEFCVLGNYDLNVYTNNIKHKKVLKRYFNNVCEITTTYYS